MLRIALSCICLVLAASLGACSKASVPLGFGYGTQSTDQHSSGIRKRLFSRTKDDKSDSQTASTKASTEKKQSESAAAKKAPTASAPVKTARKPAAPIVEHEAKDAMAKKDKAAMKYAMADSAPKMGHQAMAMAKTNAMPKKNETAVAGAVETAQAVAPQPQAKPVRVAKLVPPPSAAPAVKATAAAPQIDIIAVRDMVNAYRKKNGLKPLSLNPQLAQAAAKHSKDLASLDKISHFGSDGSNPWQRVERTGYKPKLAAENVGTGQRNFREVLKGWTESPSHNENLLLPDAKHMGIALVHDPKSKNKTFWTLILGATL